MRNFGQCRALAEPKLQVLRECFQPESIVHGGTSTSPLTANEAHLCLQWKRLREDFDSTLAKQQAAQDKFVTELLDELQSSRASASLASGCNGSKHEVVSEQVVSEQACNGKEMHGHEEKELFTENIQVYVDHETTQVNASDRVSEAPKMPLDTPSKRRSNGSTSLSWHSGDTSRERGNQGVCRVRTDISRQTQISEGSSSPQAKRTYERRTSAVELLSLSFMNSKRLQWMSDHVPCASRCFRCCRAAVEWLLGLQEPERTGYLAACVRSNAFGSLCSLVILLNMVVIFWSTNHAIDTKSFDMPQSVQIMDFLFCVFYVVEISLKMIVHRFYFFWNEDTSWNVFDCLLVGLAINDQVSNLIASEGAQSNMSFMRSVRIVKVSRILRIVRVIRIFRDLRCMLFSILGSINSLFWCLVLIFFVLLVFALLFVQLVTEHVIDEVNAGGQERMNIELLFGSVQQTMATLYMATTGGMDWREAYEMLDAMGPGVGTVCSATFIFYVAFFNFAVFNVLTGIFVDNAMKVSEADREAMMSEQVKRERTEAERLRDLCRHLDQDNDGKIDWPEFHNFLHHESGFQTMAYLGLDIHDSRQFFWNLEQLYDQKGIDHQNFVSGCMRMKGAATGIDTFTIVAEVKALKRQQEEFEAGMHHRLTSMEASRLSSRSHLPASRPEAAAMQRISELPGQAVDRQVPQQQFHALENRSGKLRM